jgi:hypothetical protein
MTTRSQTEMAQTVLEKLRVVDSQQSASATDRTFVINRYAELMEGLREEELAYWPDDEIPLLVYPAVTDLVALHVSGSFGKPMVSLIEIESAEIPIKRRIRRHTRKQSAGEDTYTLDY